MLFTDEEIERANRISILEYARMHGYVAHRVGKNYKIDGYGGLYIDDVNNRWKCFADSKGGGPIQFLMYINRVSWKEAVAELLEKEIPLYTREGSFVRKPVHVETVPVTFALPSHGSTMNHVFAYLIQSRKIDKDVVYEFVRKKMLYENEYGSCVFVGYDENGFPRCASIRGTGNKPFKQDVAGSCKEYFFHKDGSNTVLNVFEAAIDLMSYITLQKRKSPLVQSHDLTDHYIALGCLDPAALHCYLRLHPEIARIRICLDSDIHGRKAGASIYYTLSHKYSIRLDKPRLKDWNEVLCQCE